MGRKSEKRLANEKSLAGCTKMDTKASFSEVLYCLAARVTHINEH